MARKPVIPPKYELKLKTLLPNLTAKPSEIQASPIQRTTAVNTST